MRALSFVDKAEVTTLNNTIVQLKTNGAKAKEVASSS